MTERETRFVLGFVAALGVLLRVTDLGVPDFATDEAQAAMAATAAWTPLGMSILKGATALFGEHILIARSVSAIFGIACLPLIYLLALELTKKEKVALFALVVASLFPTHILFSRLAYLSIQECFWWLALTLCFLRARKHDDAKWYVALFLVTVASTMTKTQDILLPAFLVFGRIIELRTKVFKDILSWVLIIACIPFGFYVLTHPGIAATLFLYGGNMYGVSGPFVRLMTLFAMWWKLLGVYLIVIVASLPALKKLPWPYYALLAVSILTGYLLGPGHEYYATHLVFFSIPIAISLAKWRTEIMHTCLALFVGFTLLTLGPREIFLNEWTHHLYQRHGFWNVHAEEINEIIKNEATVTVLGEAGHHIRWYLTPKVLVGKNLTAPYSTNYLILLDMKDAPKAAGGTVEFAGEEMALVKMND